jgi:ATP-dependent RNA helicase SUPV3L1/SUV3
MSIPRAASGGGFFAQIGGMLEDARRAEERERERWAERIIEAPHSSFAVDDEGAVLHEDTAVGKLVAGRDLRNPRVLATIDSAIGAGARSRIERRLAAFGRDLVSELLAPVASDGVEGLVRGVLWQLEQGLGTLDVERARAELAALREEDRDALEARGISLGRRTVHARALLALEPLRLRALLVRVHRNAMEPRVPPRGAVTMMRVREVPFESYLAIGFLPLGPRAIRVDIAERVLTRLQEFDVPFEMPPEIGRWLGIKKAELPKVLGALGCLLKEGRWHVMRAREGT